MLQKGNDSFLGDLLYTYQLSLFSPGFPNFPEPIQLVCASVLQERGQVHLAAQARACGAWFAQSVPASFSQFRHRPMAMEINTSRFGPVRVECEDLLHFPAGVLGLEDCRDWVLLGDGQNDAVAWLQSVDKPKVALAVVSPRRFKPDYRIRLARAEIEPLNLTDAKAAQVLVSCSYHRKRLK